MGPGGGLIFHKAPRGFIMTDTSEICFYLEAAMNDIKADPDDLSGLSDEDRLRLLTDQVTLYGAQETRIGSGRLNTDSLHASSGKSSAANACHYYNNNSNGKDDWFIPSRDELQKLYDNRDLFGSGNFVSDGYYWSSTLDSSNPREKAYYHDFSTGVPGSTHNTTEMYVRVIRAF